VNVGRNFPGNKRALGARQHGESIQEERGWTLDVRGYDHSDRDMKRTSGQAKGNSRSRISRRSIRIASKRGEQKSSKDSLMESTRMMEKFKKITNLLNTMI